MEAFSINPITEDCILEALEYDKQAQILANLRYYKMAEECKEKAMRLRAKADYHQAPE